MRPQGWYRDPAGQSIFRWWDGESWTDRLLDRANQASKGLGHGGINSQPSSWPEPDEYATAYLPPPPELVPGGEPNRGSSRPEVPAVAGSDSRAVIKTARQLRAAGAKLLKLSEARRKVARDLISRATTESARQQFAVLPLNSLRSAGKGGMRLGALETAGYRTVAATLAAGPLKLQQVPGVGPQTATSVIAAAKAAKRATENQTIFRFDAVRQPLSHTNILEALLAVELAELAIKPLQPEIIKFQDSVDAVLPRATRAASGLRNFFSGARQKTENSNALRTLFVLLAAYEGLGDRISDATRLSVSPAQPTAALWSDYVARTAFYNGILSEFRDNNLARTSTFGAVPADIAARVEAAVLDTTLLKVSLRGYQAFGAKYALMQRQSMIGDEMGLGKTIEALAALCHLKTSGENIFLVVCPASVLVNWEHEIAQKSQLSSYKLYGDDRTRNLEAWSRNGGVGITTYETLRNMVPPVGLKISMLVVDEAHYVKNPEALRTKAVLRWITHSDRTLFMTGTPMENRVEEFRILINHLSPEVARRLRQFSGFEGAASFSAAIGPVYLRRNQKDVLDELPAKIETQEWVQFIGEDLIKYRGAVAARQFMSMRRAAYWPATIEGSAKLARLVQIAEEAMENGRKVVVFSYFLDVLAIVHDALSDYTVDPISGGVRPAARQQIIDDFTAMTRPAVLVSQIEAGGVGLNIQTASVVILCEPQWKTTTEEQAIARCHRLGQSRPVEVHRIFAVDTVDQRMLETLARKAALINAYAKPSIIKDSSNSAVDEKFATADELPISQAQVEQQIIESELVRLGIKL